MNLIDHIGNKVTVWTVEGNAMEKRKLITADEMGIVVEPYTDPDKGPLPDQDHEVFVPWNRVKYVDLIKSRTEESVESQQPFRYTYKFIKRKGEEILPENLPENTATEHHGNDNETDTWHEIKSDKLPNLSDKQLYGIFNEPQDKGNFVLNEERAKIGDIVKLNPEYVNGEKHQPDAVSILGDEEYEVTYVNLSGDGVIVYKGDEKVFLHHAWYTIVKRAEERPTYCQSCKKVKKHTHPKDGLFVCEECDPSPEDCECEERASEPSTSELVDMLAKREGVAEASINPYEPWTIIRRDGRVERGKGPVRILVVTD